MSTIDDLKSFSIPVTTTSIVDVLSSLNSGVSTLSENVTTIMSALTVATPVVSCTSNTVTMSCATTGATIKYSTDGGENYSTYSQALTITETTDYVAYAIMDGRIDSASVEYEAEYEAPAAE